MEFPLLRQWITQIVNEYLKFGNCNFVIAISHVLFTSNSEFTQQDGRKKRTAKRLSVTNVTGLLLACFVGNSLNISVFCSSTKRSV